MLKNITGIFASNHINKLISFHTLTKEQDARYPFMISNTDTFNKNGMNWQIILELHPKKQIFVFHSFGFSRFKNFTIQDERKIINKILFGLKLSNWAISSLLLE